MSYADIIKIHIIITEKNTIYIHVIWVSLKSDGHKFYLYQQNKQSTQKAKLTTTSAHIVNITSIHHKHAEMFYYVHTAQRQVIISYMSGPSASWIIR